MSEIETMLAAALAHRDAGRTAEAEALCRAILRIEPHVAATEHLLGTIALQAGYIEAAQARFMKAIALAGDVAAYHRSMGRAAALRGHHGEALASYRNALALDSNQPEVHDALSQLAQYQPQQVLAFYHSARMRAPDDAALRFYTRMRCSAPETSRMPRPPTGIPCCSSPITSVPSTIWALP